MRKTLMKAKLKICKTGVFPWWIYLISNLKISRLFSKSSIVKPFVQSCTKEWYLFNLVIIILHIKADKLSWYLLFSQKSPIFIINLLKKDLNYVSWLFIFLSFSTVGFIYYLSYPNFAELNAFSMHAVELWAKTKLD